MRERDDVLATSEVLWYLELGRGVVLGSCTSMFRQVLLVSGALLESSREQGFGSDRARVHLLAYSMRPSEVP